MRAAIYVTCSQAEFTVNPRLLIQDAMSLQEHVGQKGWELVSCSNMDLPGVFHDPAVSNRCQEAAYRPGCAAAIESGAQILVVQNLCRLAASLRLLEEFLGYVLDRGVLVASQTDDRLLGKPELESLRLALPLYSQVSSGKMRAPTAVLRARGKSQADLGPIPPYETRVIVNGEKSRIPNKAVLAVLARADELRNSGLTWQKVSDQIETELAAADGRPTLPDYPIPVERYIQMCGRAPHTTSWDFREFIDRHSHNRPPGKVSREWTPERLNRILHRRRQFFDRWLRNRGLVLNEFTVHRKVS